jgi:RimJ/RimL family protein N-acetyltransferase
MSDASSSPVEIRRLWPSDKEAFRRHLLSLDPRSRHMRFGGGVSDEFLIRYAENCFGKGDLAYGAFIENKLVGAGELRSNQAIWSEQAPFGRHIHAEAAFSVDVRYRRRGIGEKLFKRILRAATNHGVETIEIVCLPENIGMQNLAKKFHAQFAFEQNSLTGRLTVRPPTALSLIREASSDALDFGAALFDAHWRAAAETREKGA